MSRVFKTIQISVLTYCCWLLSSWWLHARLTDTVRWKEEDLGNLGHFFFNKVYRDADTDRWEASRRGVLNQPYVYNDDQNSSYIQNIMLVFDRCHHSWAAKTLNKYEHGQKDLSYTFAWAKFTIKEKLANRALVTPIPGGQLSVGAGCTIIAPVTPIPGGQLFVGAGCTTIAPVTPIPRGQLSVGAGCTIMAPVTPIPGGQLSVGAGCTIMALVTPIPGGQLSVGAGCTIIAPVIPIPWG